MQVAVGLLVATGRYIVVQKMTAHVLVQCMQCLDRMKEKGYS